MESRNNYTIPPNKGGASGAYQYIDSTWKGYAGYAQAWQAPWWIQDERAAADVEAILRTWGNDVSMVPVIWYYPKAARNPALLDVVPIPSAGNVLTIREYQLRWLNAFSYISGQPLPERIFGAAPDLSLLSGIPPVVNKNPISPLEVAFPLLGPSALASSPECGDAECAAVPAIVYGTKLQPVLVAADGVVTDVVFSDPITGAVSVTITDTFGRQFRYSGFNDDNPGTNDGKAPDHLRLTEAATVGRTVRAGEILGFLGDSDPMPDDGTADDKSDESAAIDDNVIDDTTATENDAPDEERDDLTWPHLRLEITAYDGTPINADKPVAVSLYLQTCTTGIGQWSVAPHPDLIDDPMKGITISAGRDRGAWAITDLGQVHAVGEAALIGPTTACQWAPDEPYGPGAGGNYVVPDGWDDDIDLPSYVLIAAALSGDGAGLVTPLPRG